MEWEVFAVLGYRLCLQGVRFLRQYHLLDCLSAAVLQLILW